MDRYDLARLLRTTAFSASIALGPFAMAQTCGPDVVLSFTDTATGLYTYEFQPTVSGQQGPSLVSTNWTHASDASGISTSSDSGHVFPGPGIYMVCLQATVLLQGQGTCQATHCELFEVPVDTTCQGLIPAFSISAASGVISFFDQSTSPGPISDLIWDFGDGSSGFGSMPQHAYAGPGPYQACLTVVSGNCSATICNWVYFGPPDVPCDVLLQADFDAVRVDRTIAVFDKSITSGMNAHITWDFGDGSSAEGPIAMHTYDDPGDKTICSEVQLWGPLNTDTCSSTQCQLVPGAQLTGIGEVATGDVLRAFPVPFTETVELRGSAVQHGARWELLDLRGRMLDAGTVAGDGPFTLQPRALAAGSYLLRLSGKGMPASVRMVRQ